MSELKAGVMRTPHNEGMIFDRGSSRIAVTEDETEFYLKSEVDKLIAKLKTEIEEQKRLRNMALASIPNVLKVMKIIQHQKYKRCLAMARWCKYWANYWDCCEPTDCSLFIAKAKYYRKWLDRWLKLADKFKEAK